MFRNYGAKWGNSNKRLTCTCRWQKQLSSSSGSEALMVILLPDKPQTPPVRNHTHDASIHQEEWLCQYHLKEHTKMTSRFCSFGDKSKTKQLWLRRKPKSRREKLPHVELEDFFFMKQNNANMFLQINAPKLSSTWNFLFIYLFITFPNFSKENPTNPTLFIKCLDLILTEQCGFSF